MSNCRAPFEAAPDAAWRRAPEPLLTYRFFAAFFVAFLAVVFAAAFLAAFFAILPPWLAVLFPVDRHWPITTGGLSYPASHKM